MIHHNMANIAITHISVQRCDFGAPDVPVSRQQRLVIANSMYARAALILPYFGLKNGLQTFYLCAKRI